jgi:Glycolipid 2-alpha-mannosyltransferase
LFVRICVIELWPAAERYWTYAGFDELIPMEYPLKFDNNFEISATSLWRSKEYTDYINYIDRLGGIYYRRWGDAPVKSLAVSRLVNSSELHQFSDIEYVHAWWPYKLHVDSDVY